MIREILGPEASFMVALRMMEKRKLSTRAVLALWTVARHPGIMGLELSKKLGFQLRTHVQPAIATLIRAGLIEDRRRTDIGRTPNVLHATEAGHALLDEIIPK